MENLPDPGDASFPYALLMFLRGQCPFLEANLVVKTPIQTPVVEAKLEKQKLSCSPTKRANKKKSGARKSLTLNEFLPQPPNLKTQNSKSSKKSKQKSEEPGFIPLVDDFPSLGAIPVITQPKKRIKPTLISLNSPEESTFNENVQLATNSEEVTTRERGLMRQFWNGKPKNLATTPAIPTTPPKLKTEEVLEAEPSFSGIFDVKSLDVLSTSYVSVLRDFAFDEVSFLTEVEFIFGLLLIRSSQKTTTSSHLLLSSIDNCVYFAVRTLSELSELFAFFPAPLLRHLLENSRLKNFASADFLTKIQDIFEEKSKFEKNGNLDEGLLMNSLNELSLTRENFPSQSAFHAFKRQRDDFSSLLSDWRKKNLQVTSPVKTKEESFGVRVQRLLSSGPHTINYALLAELFLSELLQCDSKDKLCLRNPQQNDGCFSFLPENTDPERMKRLEERLTRGPISEPKGGFSGSRRFFKDFLLHANNSIFSTFLGHFLLSALLKLNTSSLSQQNLRPVVRARLMGKFLGYLCFLPYQQLKKLPSDIQEAVLISRKSDDIPRILMEVLDSEGLAIAILWIAEFLSMADSLVLELSSYRLLISKLRRFRRIFLSQLFKSASVLLFLMSSMLDDLLSMPQYQRFSMYEQELQSQNLPISSKEKQTIDSWKHFQKADILVLDCVPFLSKLCHDLCQFNDNSGAKSISQKKINPIRLSKLEQSSDNDSLLIEMEQKFLKSAGPFVGRSVEICAESVAEIAKKHGLDWLRESGRQRALKMLELLLEMEEKSNLEVCSFAVVRIAKEKCLQESRRKTSTDLITKTANTSESEKVDGTLDIGDQGDNNLAGTVTELLMQLREAVKKLEVGAKLEKEECKDLLALSQAKDSAIKKMPMSVQNIVGVLQKKLETEQN